MIKSRRWEQSLFRRGDSRTVALSKPSTESPLYQLAYAHCFAVWVAHVLGRKKSFLTILPHPTLAGKRKHSIFKTSCDGQWKVPYSNAEQKRMWGKWNEPPLTALKTSLHPEKVVLFRQWAWRGALYFELFPENQTINSNKYCSQLDRPKTARDEKCAQFVNRKCIIFHWDDVRPRVSLMTRQKLLQLGW